MMRPLLVAFSACAILLTHSPSAQQVDSMLITGARLLDVVSGAYVDSAGVLVQGDRVAAIYGKSVPATVPAKVRKLEYPGATLVPGLGDMMASGSPAADLDADYFYAMSLAYGVTMHRALDLPASWAASQRGRIDTGEVLAPRLWVSGRGIDRWPSAELRLLQARDAADVTREVNQQAAAGVDWIAGFENLPPDMYRAMVTATRRSTMKVSGRPGATSILQLAQIGVDSIEGLGYPLQPRAGAGIETRRPVDAMTEFRGADQAWLQASSANLKGLITSLVRQRRVLTPMLARELRRASPEETGKDPALEQIPASRKQLLFTEMSMTSTNDAAQARQAWPRKLAFVVDFIRAGGEIVVGTGFERANYPVPGIGVHQELAWLVRAGLTPAEALKAATVSPAALVGASKSAGRIAAGYRADLLVVDGDPLAQIEDLQKIRAVIRGGELLDRNALLAQAKRAVVADRPRK